MTNWCEYSETTHGDWDEAIGQLPGSNFFQTKNWADIKCASGWQVAYIACKHGDEITSMALTLYRPHLLSGATVWLPGGICGEPDVKVGLLNEALKHILRAKWIYLRINAIGFLHDADLSRRMIASGWRKPVVTLGSGMSLIYDTTIGEITRLTTATANWRHNLKRSRKYALSFKKWLAPDIDEIMNLYRAMETRKGLEAQVTYRELSAILKLVDSSVVLYKCENMQGELIAIRACAVWRDQAFDLLAAANVSARKVYASHGLLWVLFNQCAEMGVSWYDLGGVDPIQNRGVFDFKKGTGANLINYLGEWEFGSFPFLTNMVNCLMYVKKRLQPSRR